MTRNERHANGPCGLYVLIALSLMLALATASRAQVPKTDPFPMNQPPPAGAILDLSGTPIPGGGNGTYQQYTVNFQATLASTAITFAFREDPARIILANVSVTDLTHPSGNLLVNGDFSGGVYTNNTNPRTPNGWTYANQFGAFAGGGVFSGGAPGFGPCYGQAFCWNDGAVQAFDAISQTIATTVGDTYQISFFVADNSGCQTSPGNPIIPCNFSALSTNGDITDQFGNGIDITVYAQGGLPLPAGGALWLGNDTVGDVFETSTTGSVITDLPSLPTTGIAWDGTNLYFADPSGNFTKRTADGKTVLASFFVNSTGTGEDLAWDSNRKVLWRIVHNNALQKIDPAVPSLLATYAIPTADATLGTLGGLGIAYDSTRDVLYVSYCQAGCGPIVAGLVDQVDPNTGNVMNHLFRTSGFRSGGLGYDPGTDTLWVGDFGVVRHMDRSGNVLSSFIRPAPPAGGFVDGLEFVGGTTTTQMRTTPPQTFNMTADTSVPITFNAPNQPQVQITVVFPGSGDPLIFPIGPPVQFQATDRFVANAKPYTGGTAFATAIPFDHAGNDAMAGTAGNGAKYEIICGDATHPFSEANCPTPSPGTHIRAKDSFDLPRDAMGNFIQPVITPGTTVEMMHWFPNLGAENLGGANSTVWQATSTIPHPDCPSMFQPNFACDFEGILVNKYGESNGFGSDTKKGDYLLLYNVPMPCTAVKVNGVPVNTQCVQGNSVSFVRSPLNFVFDVTPAQCPASQSPCGNGWMAAAVAELFSTFDPVASAPDLPNMLVDLTDTNPPNCPGPGLNTNANCPVPNGTSCPGTNCALTSGTPGAGPPAAPVEFTTPPPAADPATPDGKYLLQWSAGDTVRIRERNVQLLTDPLAQCPNPFPNTETTAMPPCYSTKLFNAQIDVDNTPPTITGPTLSTPNPATPTTITATYSCADPVVNGVASGIASCGSHAGLSGVNPTPTFVDTLSNTVGPHNFSVTATDVAGNSTTSPTVNYTVYNICALYDQTKAVKLGASIPIKLFLCDSTGTVDLSSASIVVHATALKQTSNSTSDPVVDDGNANPDNDFRFDSTLGPVGGSGGYIFNLSTSGLGSGSWVIQFTVSGDPTLHTLGFGIK